MLQQYSDPTGGKDEPRSPQAHEKIMSLLQDLQEHQEENGLRAEDTDPSKKRSTSSAARALKPIADNPDPTKEDLIKAVKRLQKEGMFLQAALGTLQSVVVGVDKSGKNTTPPNTTLAMYERAREVGLTQAYMAASKCGMETLEQMHSTIALMEEVHRRSGKAVFPDLSDLPSPLSVASAMSPWPETPPPPLSRGEEETDHGQRPQHQRHVRLLEDVDTSLLPESMPHKRKRMYKEMSSMVGVTHKSGALGGKAADIALYGTTEAISLAIEAAAATGAEAAGEAISGIAAILATVLEVLSACL